MSKKHRVTFGTNVGKIQKDIKRKLLFKMAAVKVDLRDYLDEKLEGDAGRTGHIYPHPDGGTYTASAPGEWPSEKTGDLRKSIRFKTIFNKDEISLEVSADVPYAEELEDYMDRPFLSRAVDERLDEIKQIMTKPL